MEHIMPPGDHGRHYARPDCPCGPAEQAVILDDASIAWVFVHPAYDGRELRALRRTTRR